jgi:hypothetical protein
MEVSGQLHDPVALHPRERAPGTHWIGGWVAPRDGLDVIHKYLLYIVYCTLHMHIKILSVLTEYTRYTETKIALLFVTYGITHGYAVC